MPADFKLFVGVDQTGASRPGGRGAYPLATAMIFETAPGSWRLCLTDARGRGLSLARFTPTDMALLLETQTALPRKRVGGVADAAWMVDCVFGLPSVVLAPRHPRAKPDSQALWREISRARRFTFEGKDFGRAPAESFFQSLRPAGKPPRRKCEVLSGANSVFHFEPYQKNVQTGTYRIWKDMAEARDGEPWANFWPMDSAQLGGRAGKRGRPWIFEGYPSLFWKNILGTSSRTPKILPSLLEKNFSDHLDISADDRRLMTQDPDYADAAVLAVGGCLLQKNGKLWEPFPGFRKLAGLRFEGWISGLTSKGAV